VRRSSWRWTVAGAVALAASLAFVPMRGAVQTAAEAATGPVFTAAGDIDGCNAGADTAKLVGKTTGPVATIGDNAYPSGSASDFAKCYDPTWGAFKDRTHPVAGNHDYDVSKATPYYQYFGAAAGAPGSGWYSYDVGSWHVVALNSNCDDVDCGKQANWLDSDLTAHPAACILAYWHHPRFTSGTSGGNDAVGAFWKVLYAHDATLVLNGHDHDYERFAPQDPSGHADPAHGIREFVVGTGGASLGGFAGVAPNSQVRNNGTYGVIELTLGDGGYDWRFVATPGSHFTDSGSDTCRGTAPAASTSTTSAPAPAASQPAPAPPPADSIAPGQSGEAGPGAADGGASGLSAPAGDSAPDAGPSPPPTSRPTHPVAPTPVRHSAAPSPPGDSPGGAAGTGAIPGRPAPTAAVAPGDDSSGAPAPAAPGAGPFAANPEMSSDPADVAAGPDRSAGASAADGGAAADDPGPLPVAIAGLIHPPPAAPPSDRRGVAGLAVVLLAVDGAGLAACRRRGANVLR